MQHVVVVSESISIGADNPLVLISGPCVIESRDHCLSVAERLISISKQVGIPLIFKSSYDKANRTSLGSFRGVGLDDGLKVLSEIKKEFNIPVITDVHTAHQARSAAEVVDVLQIPAFLCRQTDLLVAAGATGKPVMVKKGQFLHPDDMHFAKKKIQDTLSSQVERVIFCERGTCFGYRELVVDFRSLALMASHGTPVVFDATHSVQKMGGAGGASSGNREYVAMLARAAVAVGIDGLFIESHNDPDIAPSDGANMLSLDVLPKLLVELLEIRKLRQGISPV